MLAATPVLHIACPLASSLAAFHFVARSVCKLHGQMCLSDLLPVQASASQPVCLLPPACSLPGQLHSRMPP